MNWKEKVNAAPATWMVVVYLLDTGEEELSVRIEWLRTARKKVVDMAGYVEANWALTEDCHNVSPFSQWAEMGVFLDEPDVLALTAAFKRGEHLGQFPGAVAGFMPAMHS